MSLSTYHNVKYYVKIEHIAHYVCNFFVYLPCNFAQYLNFTIMIKINDFQISFHPEIVKDGADYLPWTVQGPGVFTRCRSLRNAISNVLDLQQFISFTGLPF